MVFNLTGMLKMTTDTTDFENSKDQLLGFLI